MPDVRKVYDMVTQQKPPAPGAFERQERRQVRAARNKKLGALAVAAAIAVVAVVSVVELGAARNTTPATHATTSVVPALSRPFLVDVRTGGSRPLPRSLEPDGVGAGLYVNYAASPDGTRLAYSTCMTFSCSGGKTDVMRIGNTDGTDVRTLSVPYGYNGYLPRWSPDASELVYQQRDGTSIAFGALYVYDVSTDRRTKVTDLGVPSGGWWFLSPRFTPDGRSVIFHRPNRHGPGWNVWSVPVTGGKPTIVLRDAAFPEYFPDGNRIAFVEPSVSSPAGPSLQIAEAGGSRRTLVKASSPNGIWWPEISPDGARIAYQEDYTIHVVDIATGQSSVVANGDNAEWLDDDTLIVAP